MIPIKSVASSSGSLIWKCFVGRSPQGSESTDGVECASMSSELTIFESLVKSANQRDHAEGAPNDKELTIRGLLLMLKRRRAIILWTMAVCFLLGVTLCIFLKPRYKALGTIQVQKSATDGLGLENLASPKQECIRRPRRKYRFANPGQHSSIVQFGSQSD